jgi:hypothetical protein
MVAHDSDAFEAPENLEAAVQVGAVADDITQAPQLVHPTAAIGVFEDSHEGGGVRVYVGEDGSTHIRHIISQRGFVLQINTAKKAVHPIETKNFPHLMCQFS